MSSKIFDVCNLIPTTIRDEVKNIKDILNEKKVEFYFTGSTAMSIYACILTEIVDFPSVRDILKFYDNNLFLNYIEEELNYADIFQSAVRKDLNSLRISEDFFREIHDIDIAFDFSKDFPKVMNGLGELGYRIKPPPIKNVPSEVVSKISEDGSKIILDLFNTDNELLAPSLKSKDTVYVAYKNKYGNYVYPVLNIDKLLKYKYKAIKERRPFNPKDIYDFLFLAYLKYLYDGINEFDIVPYSNTPSYKRLKDSKKRKKKNHIEEKVDNIEYEQEDEQEYDFFEIPKEDEEQRQERQKKLAEFFANYKSEF